MAIQTNEAIIERAMNEVFNTGMLAAIDQVVAPDVCVHYPQADEPLCGREQVQHVFSHARAAFADAYFMTEETIATGDHVVTRWTGRATHSGIFWGIPPTGRQILWTGATIYRFVAGKIVEIWMYADALDVLQQLGSTSIPVRSNR